MSSREQFEAWATANQNAWFPDLTRSINTPEMYYGVATQAAWEAWQASRAVPIELPAMQEAKDSHCLIYSEGWDDALNEVKDAIIAQGYRVA
jgi:hypothetical protein